MPPARFVRLSPEEDARLRAVEQDPLLKPKVRLRAQVLRLSGRGEGVGSIAAYTGRSEASVLRDLDRWEERGFGGLADDTAPGNPPRVTGEARSFMEEKLSEQRTWNASQLAEAVADRFGIGVGPETVRQHLLAMGYRWKRTRYVPSRPPDPEEEREAAGDLEELKRGCRRGARPEALGRERVLFVPAALLHLDQEGASAPAPGEDAVGPARARQPHRYALLLRG